LTEILIAILITGIIVGAIYTTYKSQQDSYVAQDQVVEMQQNLRASIYIMAREIRLAGYNPGSVPNLAGFVSTLPCDPANPADDVAIAPSATQIAFTMDANGNGVIDNAEAEQTAYRLNAANLTLEKFSLATHSWVVVAQDIEALNFVYLDGANPPNDLTGTISTNLANVRRVEITMLARTERVDREFRNDQTYTNQQSPPTWSFTAPGDNFRRRLLTTTMLCRNMGL
jgi:type IV pilus assembly protein PilW